MKLNELLEFMSRWNLKHKRIYESYSSNFSVLHQTACKEFLTNEVSYHDFYCDMKRLENLDFGETALVIYEPITGWETSVRQTSDIKEVEEVFSMLHTDFIEGALLIFEKTGQETFNYQPSPVPSGKVYRINKTNV